ncbi:MAG: CopG family ribbon-helix-helix protein [Chlorobium sp.]
MSTIIIHLQPEIEQSLQAMTSLLQKSKAWLINQALKEYIERQSVEQERWQQTLQALDSMAQGNVGAGDAAARRTKLLLSELFPFFYTLELSRFNFAL